MALSRVQLAIKASTPAAAAFARFASGAAAAGRRRLLNRAAIASLFALAGSATACTGIALVYLPAALVVGGASLAAFGLLAIDVGGKRR